MPIPVPCTIAAPDGAATQTRGWALEEFGECESEDHIAIEPD